MTPHPESLDGKPPPKRYRWWRFIEHSLPIIVIYLMVATLVSFLIAPNVIVTVPTGHVGILWKRFRGGTQLDPRLLKDEGMRVLLPWDKLFLYDLRLQTHDDTYNAISKDGVNLTATINIRFRLKHDAVPQLHQTIGPGLRQADAEPGDRQPGARDFRRIHRRRGLFDEAPGDSEEDPHPHRSDAGPEHDPADRAGERIRRALPDIAQTRCSSSTTRWCSAWSCRPTVNAAINRKIEQYYLVQEYGFRVEREKKESERKQIEANGIRDFQQTVTQGISDSYVRWRGIEATLQLAQSPNTKIVIIGSGKDGLPVILGNVDTPMQPNPARAGGPAGAATLPDNSEAARQRPAARQPAAPGKDAGQQSAEPGRTAVADRGAARGADARANSARMAPPNRPPGAAPGQAVGSGAPAESRAHLGRGPRFRISFRERSVGNAARRTVVRRRQGQARGQGQGQRPAAHAAPSRSRAPPPPQAGGAAAAPAADPRVRRGRREQLAIISLWACGSGVSDCPVDPL